MTERTKGLPKLTFVETKLFLREPAAVFFALAVPLLLLVILGSIPGFRQPISELGGLRVIDLYLPIIIAIAMTTLALSTLPTALATYRERGILRRLATTPLQPQRVLLAQMLLSLGIAIVVTAVIVAIGAAAYGTTLPRNPIGFVVAFLLVAASLCAIGLVVAAVAPRGRTATAIGAGLFYPMSFFAGLWLPRDQMPDLLRRIGDFTPLGAGVQSLQDALAGAWPQPLHLAVMAGFTLAAGLAAARWFRWQ